ncbi:AAA family ATPase [Microlunatus flavus]|uniref:ATPase AAA-type core domain-containing protein n=1 Tax=Microlunatus flavus TaxID=1036181 RepID=A0A1H9MJB2_9ACTN|nr:AAA family ATPase [Microlunatus flavus]SER23782.1 Protein of unknown function [Microlunatus flavus]
MSQVVVGSGTTRRRNRKSGPQKHFRLGVSGFKAVREEVAIDIAPLTVIAGANSSGKSSFMQPFLMLKQTLEASFDPGAILLYGPNVKFTDQSQLLSRGAAKADTVSNFKVIFGRENTTRVLQFEPGSEGFVVAKDTRILNDSELSLSATPTAAEMKKVRGLFGDKLEEVRKSFSKTLAGGGQHWDLVTSRNRFFLDPGISLVRDADSHGGVTSISISVGIDDDSSSSDEWINLLQGIIHVPGLRGNPERAYSRSAVGETYPGTFETYVASIIHSWLNPSPKDKEPAAKALAGLTSDLNLLGLTWKVATRRVNDASLELLVGRLSHARQGGAWDLVSVADVGFGVSQTLPVLVALHAAEPGQLVYIEQPEIHLHPRAQLALAECLVSATKRGVTMIIETHSSLLVRGIQTLVARKVARPRDVSLNWFDRDPETGVTVVSKADLDREGRFGDWPVDFDEISQDADWAYLEAVSQAQ